MNVSGGMAEQRQGSYRWLSILLGLIAIFAGLVAIIYPFVSALAFADVIGIILIVGAFIHLVNSIRRRTSGWSVVLGIVVAVLYAAAGVFLLSYPLKGLFVLTVVLGTLFTFVGLYRTAMSLEAMGIPGWGWALIGGILTFVLGIWILAALPTSMLWALGVIVGVDLLFFGIALLFGFAPGYTTGTTGMRYAENL